MSFLYILGALVLVFLIVTLLKMIILSRKANAVVAQALKEGKMTLDNMHVVSEKQAKSNDAWMDTAAELSESWQKRVKCPNNCGSLIAHAMRSSAEGVRKERLITE